MDSSATPQHSLGLASTLPSVLLIFAGAILLFICPEPHINLTITRSMEGVVSINIDLSTGRGIAKTVAIFAVVAGIIATLVNAAVTVLSYFDIQGPDLVKYVKRILRTLSSASFLVKATLILLFIFAGAIILLRRYGLPHPQLSHRVRNLMPGRPSRPTIIATSAQDTIDETTALRATPHRRYGTEDV